MLTLGFEVRLGVTMRAKPNRFVGPRRCPQLRVGEGNRGRRGDDLAQVLVHIP